MTITFFHRAAFVIVLLASTVTMRAQWKEVPLPAPFNSGYYLDVFFLPSDPNYGWVCSIEGFIIRTTDAGRTWDGSAIPGAFLEYVQFLTPNVGYTSGQAGVFRSVDGGRTWRDVTPFDPNFEKGWGSYWLSEYEGIYFVGGCATGIQAFYRTTDGGSSWTLFSQTEPLSGLADGIIFENGEGYAVSSGVIWQTLDRGRTWRKFSSTGTKVWSEELAISGRSMLIPTSGTDCDGQTRGVGSMRFSRDGGRTWSEYRTGANMFGAYLLDERRGWGVGDDRTVIATDDAGATWVRRNCGIRGNIDDIWFVRDDLAWAVGNGIYRSAFDLPPAFVRIAPDVPTVEVCAGDSVYLQVASNVAEVRWSDGVVAPGRFVTSAGRYVASVFDSTTCRTVSDTVLVIRKGDGTPRLTASAPVICEGDSIELRIEGVVRTLRWSTGDSTARIVVRTSGTYSCTVTDTAGCVNTVSFVATVRPLPEPTITADRSLTICLDDVVKLRAPDGFRAYLWSTGDTGSELVVGEGGAYAVTVVDEAGCVGTSDSVTVIKLATRNKAEVLAISSAGAVVIDGHPVGGMSCRDVEIRNRSQDEPFVVVRPFMVGNVFFSIPQSQLPVVIPPGGTNVLRLCATAVDSGEVWDTLALPDTCSTTFIPVVSRGNVIPLSGASRCDVAVATVIYRAGNAWQLSPPFPVPASSTLSIAVRAVTGNGGAGTLSVRTMTGHTVRSIPVTVTPVLTDCTVSVDDLPIGPYMLSVDVGGTLLGSSVVHIIR